MTESVSWKGGASFVFRGFWLSGLGFGLRVCDFFFGFRVTTVLFGA